jgi:hypothetical protein
MFPLKSERAGVRLREGKKLGVRGEKAWSRKSRKANRLEARW